MRTKNSGYPVGPVGVDFNTHIYICIYIPIKKHVELIMKSIKLISEFVTKNMNNK